MMSLYDKIIRLYPTLVFADFLPPTGTIFLQNDGQGDYIKSWSNHNPEPTAAQLAAITE
jgi:hypothetical protein